MQLRDFHYKKNGVLHIIYWCRTVEIEESTFEIAFYLKKKFLSDLIFGQSWIPLTWGIVFLQHGRIFNEGAFRVGPQSVLQALRCVDPEVLRLLPFADIVPEEILDVGPADRPWHER